MNDGRSTVCSTHVPVEAIASQLGRHRSTIYREIGRNQFHDIKLYRGYYPVTADDSAKKRRQRQRKLVRDAWLRDYVVAKLALCWSPEQIAGRLRQLSEDPCLCQETIYQFIYGPEGQALKLHRYLLRVRRLRRQRLGRTSRGLKIPLARTIAQRPAKIGQRFQTVEASGEAAILLIIPEAAYEQGPGGIDCCFDILGEPSVSVDPGEEPFDDPPSGLDSETDLVGILADDLDGDDRRIGNSVARVTAIGERPLDEREERTGGFQQRASTVPVLHAGRMRLENECPPVRVDQGMAFAALDLLPGIVTHNATRLCGFDALTVDDRRRGAGSATRPFPVGHDESVVDLLEHASVTPSREPSIDRAPWWKIARQQAPCDAAPHDVENRVDDLSHVPGSRPSHHL